MNGTTARCSGPRCRRDSPSALQTCGGCKQARYCSRDCQRDSWKSHKTYCQHVSTNGASSASLDPMDYYEKIAVHEPAVRALAREIRLPVSTPVGMQ